MSKANRITGDLLILLSPLRLLVSRRKIVECATAVLLPVRISPMPGRKNSSKEKKTAAAPTVSPIDPKEQLQAEMRSLGYVEGLFISLYTIIHANKLPSQACSSISEFFLLCRFDEDIFTRNLEASVEPNMWGGKGP